MEAVEEEFPNEREEDTLDAIGKDLGGQATPEEAGDTVFGKDQGDGGSVGDGDVICLDEGFDDAGRIGDAVGDDGGDEPNQGAAGMDDEVAAWWWRGDGGFEDVIAAPPGVTPNEGGDEGTGGSGPEGQDPGVVDAVDEGRETGPALDLEDGFDRVNGHNGDAPTCGGETRDGRLDSDGDVRRREGRKDPGVGGRVPEPREGSLEEGHRDARIETPNSTVFIEVPHRLHQRPAVPHLIIDRRPEPHQQHHLTYHGPRSEGPTTERLPHRSPHPRSHPSLNKSARFLQS